MHKLTHFIILSRSLFTKKIFIRDIGLPICRECKYFIKGSNNYPYDPIPSDELYGKCAKFGTIDLITGETEYDNAMLCRLDENKCGKFGSEFINK
jgi:hypothetical protein